MREKGLIYSLEVVFLASIVLVVFMALATFTFNSNPEYDLMNSMKVAHDMGEANSSSPPKGFNYSDTCTSGTRYGSGIYSFNGTAEEDRMICVVGANE